MGTHWSQPFKLFFWVAFALSCTRGIPEPTRSQVIIHPAGHDPVVVQVETADSGPKLQRGLMFRTNLPKNQGMLFLFPEDSDHSFWMKNTPLPLDIIFISVQGLIVGIAEKTEPFSIKGIRVGKLSRFVLEVNAGFAQKHRLAIGDRVTYEGIQSPLLPKRGAAQRSVDLAQTVALN